MAHSFPKLALLGLLFGISTVSIGNADTITVGDGVAFIDSRGGPLTDVFLTGTTRGFQLGTFLTTAPVSPHRVCSGTGCPAGTIVDMQAVLGGPHFGSLGFGYFAQLDGVTYANTSVGTPFLRVTGRLEFDAPPIVLPPPRGTHEHDFRSPFTFQGHVAAFELDDPENALFRLNLQGSGTAHLHMFPFQFGDNYAHPHLAYRFETVQPVPEPSTLVLLATGAGVLARRLRTRTAIER